MMLRGTPGRAVLVSALTASLVTVPASPAPAAAPAPAVGAKSAYLWDATANRAHWAKAPHVRRPIASLTKMMTAEIVLGEGGLDRVVTVQKKHTAYAPKYGGSTARLRAGDRLTVRQLLYALLLPSGCDAAYVLADVYGPGQEAFVAKMNRRAEALKMSNTTYANFDGLPWPTQTSTASTAHDQIRLIRHLMKRPNFRKTVRRTSYSLRATAQRRAYTWTNTNRLLRSYPGTIGVKTGFTNAAGYSLAFSATRKGRTFYGVVLNSSTTAETARFTDAATLLDHAYRTRNARRMAVPPVPPGANTD
ncbi:D-alanyl-D-alanine carboxypeptidase family protein [Actinomadura flavalba]|uniref:D-alanyl-D-alanine carboxypeptidase family protein n=1 Tax=Actinomadura flavalba TaxID=1120938 RepID=UPI0003A151DE|nr:serine hydrolase [Actinomadura flavalba]